MSTQTQTALLDGPAPDAGRAMQRAFLWLAGSLATAGGIFGLTALIAAENDREAGRMMIAAQKGTSYLATVVSASATTQARPLRY